MSTVPMEITMLISVQYMIIQGLRLILVNQVLVRNVKRVNGPRPTGLQTSCKMVEYTVILAKKELASLNSLPLVVIILSHALILR